MSLKRLSIHEMIALSGPWADRSATVRARLQAIPEVNGILPRLDEAHTMLAQVAAEGPEELAEISSAAATVDERHDRLVRGIHGVLTAFSQFASGARAEQLLQLRDRLLPEGLSQTQKPYREEVALALFMESRVGPAEKALLAELPLPGGETVQAAVDRLVATAHELGQLEDQRSATLTRELHVLLARNKWIRAVQALESNLALAVGDEEATALLGPVHTAAKVAEHRAAI